MNHIHRQYLILSCFKNGSMMSSIDVNCEKMIVLSSPSDSSSIVCSRSRMARIFVESGGRLLAAGSDLRRAFSASGWQSLQCVASGFRVFERVNLVNDGLSSRAIAKKAADALALAHLAFRAAGHAHVLHHVREVIGVVDILSLAHGLRLNRVPISIEILRNKRRVVARYRWTSEARRQGRRNVANLP